MPRLEIVRLKRTIGVVEHHLGVTLEQQGERAAGSANIYGLPQPVQHEHMLVQN